MTEAQIRYFQLEETKKHDRAQEANWSASLQETQRHNLQSESLSRYATDVAKWSAQLSSNTSRYVAETQAAASRYAADRHYDASIYAANVNARTQKYVSDQNARMQAAVANLNARVSRYATDTQAATQRYVSDQNAATAIYGSNMAAATSIYRTDIESQDRQARLQFDRQTQLVKNSLEQRKVQLEQLRTMQNNAESRARVQKMATETRQAAQQLLLQAERLHMDEEAKKYENILNQARSTESDTKSVKNISSALVDVVNLVNKLLAIF